MREILYIQAGNFSNFVGTHFWNTEESYTSDEDSQIEHDISFRKQNTQDQTLCPRLLMFDWRGNWGTLNKANSLGQRPDRAISQGNLWSGAVQEIRQAPIAPSVYQDYLAQEESNDDDKAQDDDADALTDVKPGFGEETVRYWSDYTRVYYAPTTVHQVPEPPERSSECGDPNGNWGISEGVFGRYNEEHDLMEDSVRLSLEECDTLQGLQVLNDVDGFGGFISSFLTAFRDDCSKTATLAFGILSGNNVEDLENLDFNNTKVVQATMTDTLYLRSLKELGGLTVPLQPPNAWKEGCWQDANLQPASTMSLYYTSALLSTYIESATLPLRTSQETISSFSSKVLWQSTAPYGELVGTIPLSLSNISEENMKHLGRQNFSRGFSERLESKPNLPERFSSIQVSRGFSEADVRLYDVVGSGRVSSAQVVTSYHAKAYPLPSSFPAHMWGEEFIAPKTASSLPSMKGVSSIMGSQADYLTTNDSSRGSGSLRGLFEGYAKFAEGCLKRRDEKALEGVGVDVDEVRDLVNDLWTIVDGHGGGEQ